MSETFQRNVIAFPKPKQHKRRRTDTGHAVIALPLRTPEQVREHLLRMQVAIQVAMLTLDGAAAHGANVALEGVGTVFAGLAELLL